MEMNHRRGRAAVAPWGPWEQALLCGDVSCGESWCRVRRWPLRFLAGIGWAGVPGRGSQAEGLSVGNSTTFPGPQEVGEGKE